MLSLASGTVQPSALLSNARSTIATLIQRPSSVTTSNAFDEFSILDQLIDVSNDVDRSDDGENRKFLNIAQLITASTCIYSRRVDALYKLINSFQSSTPNAIDDNDPDDQDDLSDSSSSRAVQEEAEKQEKVTKPSKSEKKKTTSDRQRSFICSDQTKINFNTTKNFFLDRTSLFDLKIFQKYIPLGNRQFWINDHRPMIFDLLFTRDILESADDHCPLPETQRLAIALNRPASPPLPTRPSIPLLTTFDDDIPLPIGDDDSPDSSWHQSILPARELVVEKRPQTRDRKKKVKSNDLDLNIFRTGLTDQQQALFRCHKMKLPLVKTKMDSSHFFTKTFHRKHFDALIKGECELLRWACSLCSTGKDYFISPLDCSSSIQSLCICPTITIQHYSIRERYTTKVDRSFSRAIRSPPIPLAEVLDQETFMPLSTSSPLSTFIHDVDEDADIRLQTDMEHFLDAAICQSNEEQEHNRTFLTLRSSILIYMNEHQATNTTNVDDLIDSLHDHYSLPLVFSQLLHLCASTQRYHLHSTTAENLFIEKVN